MTMLSDICHVYFKNFVNIEPIIFHGRDVTDRKVVGRRFGIIITLVPTRHFKSKKNYVVRRVNIFYGLEPNSCPKTLKCEAL